MHKAIVIGATSGIGKGLAKILAHNNYVVGITGRRTELLNELKNEISNAYFIKSFDITDAKSTCQKLEELTTELGGLDLLILSSGTGDLNETLDLDIEHRTIATNVVGFTNILIWAFNFFKRQNYGHLVAISSIAGLRGNRHAPAYNATKAYQINYLEGLRQKANRLNSPIFITDIRPGFVNTDMAKSEGKFWVATVDKAVLQIFEAIKQQKNIVYITKRWRLIAIILRMIPSKIYDKA
jgi:short-subunit dehydrogenase